MTHTETLQQRWDAVMMSNYGTPPLALASGEGAVLTDVDGKTYLDLLAGIAVNILGHGHPALIEAVTRQVTTLGHTSNLYAHEPGVALAEALVTQWGVEGARVFFCNSGTEANELAFKLSRLTGRSKLVATQRAFHGRTMGSLALTGQPDKQAPFAPLPGEVTHVPYGDVDALAAAVTSDTAAVFLEPIMGEAGVVVPPPGYLAAARKITAQHGVLLVIDEVQTGMGRTGAFFAHQHEAITPDVVTMAKGLGRRAADRRVSGSRACRRAAEARPARQHLRRQPNLRGSCAGGAAHPERRRTDSTRGGARHIAAPRHRIAEPPLGGPCAGPRPAVRRGVDPADGQGGRGGGAQRRFPCQRRRARRYPAGAAAGDHRRPSRPVRGELARCAGPSRRMMRTPAAWNSSGSHRQTLVAFHQDAPLDKLFHVNSVVRHIDALRGSADPLIGENV